ncbi:MAG TPA: DUF6311 domain-containing protein, partial [Burkholderiaceae bacterium]
MALLRHYWRALLVGLAAFCAFASPAILPPGRLDWLLTQGDPAQHFIGWHFYRHTPLTQLPPGANPAYGEQLASSIVYTDSIPLLALPLRLFDGVLPAQFQYMGLWMLACFVLQALFAWKLLEPYAAGRRGSVLLPATALLVLAPIMLTRLYGHEALAGQWLILAALHLYLSRRAATGKWVLLALAATLVHAYLLAMVAAVWLTASARALLAGTYARRDVGLQALLVPLTIVLAAWTAGYFVLPPGGHMSGFGTYRMDLNAFVSPLTVWSNFGATAYEPGEYEGFAYLGAGVLALAVYVVALRLYRHTTTPGPRVFDAPL